MKPIESFSFSAYDLIRSAVVLKSVSEATD